MRLPPSKERQAMEFNPTQPVYLRDGRLYFEQNGTMSIGWTPRFSATMSADGIDTSIPLYRNGFRLAQLDELVEAARFLHHQDDIQRNRFHRMADDIAEFVNLFPHDGAIYQVIKAFPDSHVPVLSAVHMPEFRDLLRHNPILAYCLAQHHWFWGIPSRNFEERLARSLGNRQRTIAIEVGFCFGPDLCMATMFKKTDVSAASWPLLSHLKSMWCFLMNI